MTGLSQPVVCRKNRPPDLLSFISSGKVIALRFLLVVAQIGVPQICLQWKVWTLDWRNILRLAHRQYFEYFEYFETCSPPCLGGGSPCGRGAAGCSSPERSFDMRVIFKGPYICSGFLHNSFCEILFFGHLTINLHHSKTSLRATVTFWKWKSLKEKSDVVLLKSKSWQKLKVSGNPPFSGTCIAGSRRDILGRLAWLWLVAGTCDIFSQ